MAKENLSRLEGEYIPEDKEKYDEREPSVDSAYMAEVRRLALQVIHSKQSGEKPKILPPSNERRTPARNFNVSPAANDGSATPTGLETAGARLEELRQKMKSGTRESNGRLLEEVKKHDPELYEAFWKPFNESNQRIQEAGEQNKASMAAHDLMDNITRQAFKNVTATRAQSLNTAFETGTQDGKTKKPAA